MFRILHLGDITDECTIWLVFMLYVFFVSSYSAFDNFHVTGAIN